ncbi:MAG TPA: glycosyltransferase family 39 protein [bacterium]|nr:glycosyltransferase family 39 protein [bacterium]
MVKNTTLPEGTWPRVRLWLERLAPFGFFALKLGVSVFFVAYYVWRFRRIMYIADGPGRGIEAYHLAFAGFDLFPTHQFPPLPLWIWAGLLRIWHDIYFTGTAMNVVAGAGVAAFLYLLGRRLAGPLAGAVAAVLFTFSPVHHNLTLSMGMAEPVFYFWLVAGIFFAARGEAGLPGPAAAAFCFAAAALSRYEGMAFLALYSAYRLIRRRPKDVGGWLLFAAPLVLAGIFVAHKGLQPSYKGLWPALAGVRADTAAVLTNPTWYRRLGYGVYRFLFDARASAVLAFAGAALVFRRRWRTPDRIMIWLGWALIFAALTVIAVVVGLGFCPERYFATPLMLIFPFAGLAVVALVKLVKRPSAILKGIAVGAVLAVAVGITARWDSIIMTPGYGFPGPCNTRPAFATETALKLRELWREGALEPQEIILIEIGEPGAGGSWTFEEYPLRAFSDHPLHFLREPRSVLSGELSYLVPLMRENYIRIAIIVSEENREKIRWYYEDICAAAVVYENPTQTIVVLRERWAKVPDLSSMICRDLVKVYDVPAKNR